MMRETPPSCGGFLIIEKECIVLRNLVVPRRVSVYYWVVREIPKFLKPLFGLFLEPPSECARRDLRIGSLTKLEGAVRNALMPKQNGNSQVSLPYFPFDIKWIAFPNASNLAKQVGPSFAKGSINDIRMCEHLSFFMTNP